jgi:hypothetical protein
MRQKSDVWLAVLIVALGFGLIAAIPFIQF